MRIILYTWAPFRTDSLFLMTTLTFYMGSISNRFSVSNDHINILQQVVEDRSVEEAIIRSYKRSFNGFSARLTEKEYQNLKNKKELVSVFPSRTLQPRTTRSWDFLGMPEPTRKQIEAQTDIIIGVIDTGIWPESPSFNDDGLSPVPKKWKGGCHGGQNFTCNKKIIGARGYTDKSGGARDEVGHGSDTASTVAGRKVEGVSFFGIAKGTARGGVPSARIAVYKVCTPFGCDEANILAAFDDAIADGVDLISISIGGQAFEFYTDGIAIGSFHAMAKGVLTVQAAGNEKIPGSVESVAPWILSVAASSIDRRIISKIVLGNGITLIGNSVNSFKLEDEYPLVFGKDASRCEESYAKSCLDGCLHSSLVKGKIVVCEASHDSYRVPFYAGALGVLGMASSDNYSSIYPFPAASLHDNEFAALKSYLNSTKAPMGKILKSEVTNDTTAPVVASFSSKGPNPIASDILKPDISTPGVDILASFSPKVYPSDFSGDKRSVIYSVLSGTSMACPHVSGAAAFVKSVHPDWSPSAIKSALMTTADPMSPSKNPDAEFAYGSGHLNPYKATHPGLVYEATENDYITFLCKLGYSKGNISLIAGNNLTTCSKTRDQSPKDVNYPSMSALVDMEKTFTVSFSRTVTNVGKSNSTYKAKIKSSSSNIKVTIKPTTLFFKSLHESRSFEVTVAGKGLLAQSLGSASLVWSDGVHSVKSPIVVYTL